MDYSSLGGGGGGGGGKAQSAASSATSGQVFGSINQGGEAGAFGGPVVLGAVAVFVLGLVALVWAITKGK